MHTRPMRHEIIMKPRLTTAFIPLLALLPVPLFGNLVQLSFLPSSQDVFVNGTVQVAVNISLLNIGEPPSLGTYDLDVSYNPLLLNFLNVTFGDPILGNQLDLFGLGNIQSFTIGLGSVNLFELSFDSAADLDAFQAGDFTLFVLSFSAIAPGTNPLTLNVNALGDAIGGPINFTQQDGSVNIIGQTSEIPEPSTAYLALFAVTAILALPSRRSRHV